MEANNWRTGLSPEFRKEIIHKIIGTIKNAASASKHPSEIEKFARRGEYERIALSFEQKMYLISTSEKNYVQRIALKMMSMKSPPDEATNCLLRDTAENPADQASRGSQSQLHDQGQSFANPMTQPCQQPSSQRILNHIASARAQNLVCAKSETTPITGSAQTSMPIAVDQRTSLQNISGILQDPLESLFGQGTYSNSLSNPHRQMEGREQAPIGAIPQQHRQQLQKQNTLSDAQMQSSEQTLMQTQSAMRLSLAQSSSSPGLLQNQQCPVQQSTQSLHQQHPQAIMQQQQPQQALVIEHQPAPCLHQLLLPPLQKQQFIGQLQDYTGVQLDQYNGQQNSLSNKQHQHKLLAPNHHSSLHLQQVGWQINTPSSHGAQSGDSRMRNNQDIQTSGSLLQHHNLVTHHQQSSQSESAFPAESSMSLDSTSEVRQANGHDWQEEIYQKVVGMKNMYLPKMRETHEMIQLLVRSPQINSLPEQEKNARLEWFKKIMDALKYFAGFLRLPKNKISIEHKRLLDVFEKKIISFLKSCGPETFSRSLQQRHPHLLVQSSQISMLPHSQKPQALPHANEINAHLQSKNLHHSQIATQKNIMESLQHDSMITYDTSVSPQNMMNLQQTEKIFDARQGIGSSSFLNDPATAPQSITILSQSRQDINPTESNTDMLPDMHMKSQKVQKITQPEFTKQKVHQSQMKGQFFPQKQQMVNHCNQQSAELQPWQMPYVHQMDEISNHRVRRGINETGNILLHHPIAGQHSVHNHHEVKSAPLYSFPSSSIRENAEELISGVSSLSNSENGENAEELISGVSSLPNSENTGLQQTTGEVALATPFVIATPGLSASPLLALCKNADGSHDGVPAIDFCNSGVSEQPIEHLIKVVGSMSREALRASVGDMESIVTAVERTAGTIPGDGSVAEIGEDLAAMTNFQLEGKNYTLPIGFTGRRKKRCYASEVPSNTVLSGSSINGSFQLLTHCETTDLKSTSTSYGKRPRIEANYSLLEEIREINWQLIDTVVEISEEDVNAMGIASVIDGREGTIVKCFFRPVAFSPKLTSWNPSVKLVPIQPLRLLVPTKNPIFSPIIIDKLSVETSVDSTGDDLSTKTKSKLDRYLKTIPQPMSLGEIAKTYDLCARTLLCEYAQCNGGGTFSSRYGTWKNCKSAA